MIKPEAVEAGNTGAILNKIETSGFRIVAMKFIPPNIELPPSNKTLKIQII